MTAWARLLRRLPASSRAYSSFFSSRSGGGGRYFTSAKVPKVVVASKGAAPKPEPAPESTQDAPQTTNENANPVINAADKPSPASSQTSSASSATASQATGKNTTTEVPYTSDSILPQQPPHPVLNPKDFKLHQFFSLHRPLLLLPRPNSILDSANASSFLPTEANETGMYVTTPQWLLDEFPEATVDADAATAQQLARAITMNHAGAAVSWEQTLRRLGFVEKDSIALQDVTMDSTKRKRRKKMKKHKLKKRRKATRAQRLKIGR